MLRFLRYLRIAFSATCLIACLLMIALWVRSYWLVDVVEQRWPGRFQFASFGGRVGFSERSNPDISLFRDAMEELDDEVGDVFAYTVPKDFSMDEFPAICGFGWRDDGLVATLTVPDWFFVMISALCAAAPWFRWRFSLRTLLIATTLVAVVLGIIVWLGS
jgi:hypothetical protein